MLNALTVFNHFDLTNIGNLVKQNVAANPARTLCGDWQGFTLLDNAILKEVIWYGDKVFYLIGLVIAKKIKVWAFFSATLEIIEE